MSKRVGEILNELEHYGVLGMKWGVRKDADKAYSKASQKLRKLDKKSVKARSKYTKKQIKADAKMAYATNKKRYKKAVKAEVKARRAKLKANRTTRRAITWYKKMESVFANVKVSDISQEDIDLGKQYANMIWEQERSGTVRMKAH